MEPMSYIYKDGKMIPGRHIEVRDDNDYGHEVGTFVPYRVY